MNRKSKVFIAIAAVGAILVAVLLFSGFEKNRADQWQFVQYPWGGTTIRDQPGWYPIWGGTATTYDREASIGWGAVDPDSVDFFQSGKIRTSFSDNGEGHQSGYVRIQTPSSEDDRRAFHIKYSDMDGAVSAVLSYTTRILKVSGPTMTASEHKQSRKAEFLQLVDAQLTQGDYQFVQVDIIDPSGLTEEVEVVNDQTGEVETVIRNVMITANEVRRDESDQPIISGPPPYAAVGMSISQFEITATEYDERSIEQFNNRQNALLAAQSAKAERDKARQEAEKIEAEKLAELAEVAGEANKAKERARIEAQMKAEVALELKKEADNLAEKAKVEATMRKDVAALDLEAAKLDAQAIIELAQANEQKILLAGAITEKDRVLATIDKEARIGIAEHLSGVRVPAFVIGGGAPGTAGEGGDVASNGGQSAILENMMSLYLLQQMGVMNPAVVQNASYSAPPSRPTSGPEEGR